MYTRIGLSWLQQPWQCMLSVMALMEWHRHWHCVRVSVPCSSLSGILDACLEPLTGHLDVPSTWLAWRGLSQIKNLIATSTTADTSTKAIVGAINSVVSEMKKVIAAKDAKDARTVTMHPCVEELPACGAAAAAVAVTNAADPTIWL